MSSQSYQYVLAATAELQRSYTKDSDGNPDIESPPCRPLRYNRASHASSSAPSVFSFSSHSRSQSASHTPPANSTPRAFSWSWLVSLMLTAMLSSAVTAAAVLLWTGGDVRLVSQLSSLPLTPSFATGDPLHSAHLLAAARSDSERTLLSVPPAASSFPPSHIPSVATSVPASSLVSDASIAALRGMVAAGRLVDDKQADGNLLIVGVVNFGYIDFALNWLCFVRRHAIHNYLLVAVDDRSVMHLTMLGYGEHVVHVQQLFPEDVLFKECGGVNTHSYRTTCFNRQTELKSLMVLTALMAGYNVVLSDMDIAFIHNPLHYMPLSHYWEMQLEPHEWCTGLYFVQCNPFTVQMETAITLGVRRNNDKDDQEVFNKWITYHRIYMPNVLSEQLFPLDRTLFPIGKDYGQAGAVVQHNNWLNGADEKRRRQHAHGLFLFNSTLTAAAVEGWIAAEVAKGVNLTNIRYTIGTNVNAEAVFDLVPLRDEWVHDGALLQCDVCVACDNMTAAVPPLRNTWPGKLLRDTFKPEDGYMGPISSHP